MSTTCCRRSRTGWRRCEHGGLWFAVLRVAVALAIGVAAPAPAIATVRVVTTIETVASITRTVGGNRVSVRALAGGRADPHRVEPMPAIVRALSTADLLAVVGVGLESGWLPRRWLRHATRGSCRAAPDTWTARSRLNRLAARAPRPAAVARSPILTTGFRPRMRCALPRRSHDGLARSTQVARRPTRLGCCPSAARSWDARPRGRRKRGPSRDRRS